MSYTSLLMLRAHLFFEVWDSVGMEEHYWCSDTKVERYGTLGVNFEDTRHGRIDAAA